jgi:pimeloyl-ACP methyl ester carboxylesterase
MQDTVLFIHGMFQNAKSWNQWIPLLESRGYECLAVSWPLHHGDPSALRKNPPVDLGKLRLQAVVDHYVGLIEARRLNPILIGHSVGGLVVQKLVERGLAKVGVAISSVAPNRMLAFDWGFFLNSLQITNPLVGDVPFEMTPEGFHQNFANTLSAAESNRAFERTVTHDSRNVMRDCMAEIGHIDVSRPHVPLLFIAGEKDRIIPPQLCKKNADAYDDTASISTYIEFPNRGHFICGEPSWEEVANYAADWILSIETPDRRAEVASQRQ